MSSRVSSPILPAEGEWRSLAPHPGTIAWRHGSDARVLLGAGCALLLQVAHPTVAAGVEEHSNFQR
ncbi:MAG: oxygenase MpaB family protein, partial [Solirubrobacterales bacterium]|nr:oxygenase MpaB family protein [Solirubrobacterales bacterium]